MPASPLARSTLDFHAPIARSLGYDVLDTNPNAPWAEILGWHSRRLSRYGFEKWGEKVVGPWGLRCSVVSKFTRMVLALRIDVFFNLCCFFTWNSSDFAVSLLVVSSTRSLRRKVNTSMKLPHPSLFGSRFYFFMEISFDVAFCTRTHTDCTWLHDDKQRLYNWLSDWRPLRTMIGSNPVLIMGFYCCLHIIGRPRFLG